MFEHLEASLIHSMPEAMTDDIKAAFDGVSVATIGHLLWTGFLDHRRIKARQPDRRIIGCAVTLRLPTSDSSLLHYLTGRVRPGDIVVIDRCGDDRLACLGGNVAMALKLAGAEGVVVDGPICDPDEIREHDLPVWSRGISPMTTKRSTPAGDINDPVCVGGILIRPGDVVLADESGVVCIPRETALAVGRAATHKEQSGIDRRADMKAGKTLGELSGADALIADCLKNGTLQ